jgi:hypothetical protein
MNLLQEVPTAVLVRTVWNRRCFDFSGGNVRVQRVRRFFYKLIVRKVLEMGATSIVRR